MPSVSEAQRRAMEAAAHGRSSLGIPKDVGEEFVSKDAKGHAAGTLFVAPDGDVLLLRRSSAEANYAGHWALPGGGGEDGESPEDTAAREAKEEMGDVPKGARKVLDRRISPTGIAFHTFAQPVDDKFVPKLNDEHSGYAWAPLDQLPEPLHPGVKATLHDRLGLAADMTPEDWSGLRNGFAKWTREEENEPEHKERAPIETRLERLAARRTGALDVIALDRATVRRIDQDGHLFVERTPISKANICPYNGSEIPEHEALGLDPSRVYRLYRAPEELAKAASTFAGKPLLIIHKPVSADDHPHEIVVGSIGDDVQFDAPYLTAPLNIWDGEAISLIESDKQKELSCGYRYDADMTPGTAAGESFDGVMRNIFGNHLALVEEGRAGPDVVVGDSKHVETRTTEMKTVLTRKGAAAHGALSAFVMPKLAKDAKFDLTPILAKLTGANFKDSRPAILAGIAAGTKGKLAKDATLETGDLEKILDVVEALSPTEVTDEDPGVVDPDSVMDADGLSPEEEAQYQALCKRRKPGAADAEETPEEKKAREAREAAATAEKTAKDAEMKDMVPKAAMDTAIATAVKTAVATATKTQQEIHDAERAVRPYVGELAMAHDSAESVYRTALTSMGIKIDGIHASALPAILSMQPLPGANRPARLAADAASGAEAEFRKMFPDAKPLVRS